MIVLISVKKCVTVSETLSITRCTQLDYEAEERRIHYIHPI
jgi:hypothetical protein